MAAQSASNPFSQLPSSTGQTGNQQGPSQSGESQFPTVPIRPNPDITNVSPGQEAEEQQRELQAQKERQAREHASPTPSQEPDTEFQDFVARSLGAKLPIFGHNLFENVPSTFAPLDRVQVTPDYLIGPGDELVIRAWGQINVDYRYVVDRAGTL